MIQEARVLYTGRQESTQVVIQFLILLLIDCLCSGFWYISWILYAVYFLKTVRLLEESTHVTPFSVHVFGSSKINFDWNFFQNRLGQNTIESYWSLT